MCPFLFSFSVRTALCRLALCTVIQSSKNKNKKTLNFEKVLSSSVGTHYYTVAGREK